MYNLLIERLIDSFLTEEDFKSLNIRSFQGSAHKDRTNKFVDYLTKGTPLPLVKDSKPVTVSNVLVTIDGKTTKYDPATQAEELKKVLPSLKSYDKLILQDTNGSKYSISAFAKTRELGGKGKGGTLGPERSAIASLQKQFEEIGKPITVVLGDTEYPNVTGVTNVKENQKADFALVQNGDPVIFISYKPGNSVQSVISYGGLTKGSEKADEVVAFVAAVKENVSDFEGLGYEFGAPLEDQAVARKAIYGVDYGSSTYGINNVQALMQGDIRLVQKGDVYELTSNHTIISPTIPEGDYAPYLNARYAGDRNQFGIKHARFGVVPMGARKNIKILK